jgi:HK97 family phage major capsid protein
MTTVELREKRAGVISEARKIWDEAQKREGGPTTEDQQTFDNHMAEADRLRAQFERAERLESEERSLDDPGERRSAPIPAGSLPGGKMSPAEYRASAHYQSVFRDWLAYGNEAISAIPREYRDTILGTDAKGGFLVTPVKLGNEIIKSIDDTTFMLNLITKVPLMEAKSLGVPQLTARMADANWTTEIAAVTEDTTMATGRRDLTPQMLTKLSKVSLRMLSAMSAAEPFLRNELGYKNGITIEKGFLTGNGTPPQPLGVFTASASGVPTGRDVSTGNTTTAIGADNLFEVKYSLKAGYLSDPSCRWIFHRDAVKQIAKLKDTTNQYLWQPGLAAGQPDRLLGIQVLQSEYAPNTFTTGLYVGILGAFRYYWTAYVGTENGPDISIQRLVERYADTNEIGFISRAMIDGSPVLGEAFARVKLA